MSPPIDVSVKDGITTITINRPEKKNALTQAMYATMADAITNYGEADDSRALVITGVGDMFTAGNDLADFATGSHGDGVPPVIRFLEAIKNCPKPLIAAVNGGAIGVGLTMLLHCDLVIASDNASFSAPFISLGLVPEAASSMLLPAVVGMAMANDIFMTGRRLSADEAHQHGLVSRVYSQSDLATEVGKLASQVAGSAPQAMVSSKALIRHNRAAIEAQMKAEGEQFVRQLQSTEFAEVIAAKMQKRTPNFQ